MKELLRKLLRRAKIMSDPFRETVEAAVARAAAGGGPQATVLDVGCGNHSPTTFKAAFDVHYTGIDIQEYAIDEHDREVADELIILGCRPDEYTDRLAAALAGRRFDIVTMRHVVEHLDHPLETVELLASLVAPGGSLYLSFPSEASVGFPKGTNSTLNFYDDPTHVWLPDLASVLRSVSTSCRVVRIIPRYRGGAGLGLVSRLVTAPASWRARRTGTMPVSGHTWRAYGFESIVVGQRPMADVPAPAAA